MAANVSRRNFAKLFAVGGSAALLADPIFAREMTAAGDILPAGPDEVRAHGRLERGEQEFVVRGTPAEERDEVPLVLVRGQPDLVEADRDDGTFRPPFALHPGHHPGPDQPGQPAAGVRPPRPGVVPQVAALADHPQGPPHVPQPGPTRLAHVPILCLEEYPPTEPPS